MRGPVARETEEKTRKPKNVARNEDARAPGAQQEATQARDSV